MPIFRIIRIFFLLVLLVAVAASTYLAKARSTDWNNTLYLKVYPISGDGSESAKRHIATLAESDFVDIENFLAREIERYGLPLKRPLRVLLGEPIGDQPPGVGDPDSLVKVMAWSLRLRWWARSVAAPQDDPPPDVRMFVRYHAPSATLRLDNSVGLQKGLVGIVNAYAGRAHTPKNNFIIAHEFLHTLGASDKYNPANGQPSFPDGFAEPERTPLYPQRLAEVMGGRIATSEHESHIPASLAHARIGPVTAAEIGLRGAADE